MAVLKLALVVISVFATACTGKSNPAAPTGPTPPTATNLVISGADAVRTGLFTTYTVTSTLSDGTTRAVTPTWSSSNTGVASVDSAGRLEGRAHGSITLTASHEGRSASKAVQVINDYEGDWVGKFVVNGCDAPPGVCAEREVDVFSFPIRLEVSQLGNDQSEIRAVLILPSYFQIRANLSGRVTSDGRLNLAGSAEVPDYRGTRLATFHIGAWDTILNGPGMMTGRWAQRLSYLEPQYSEIMENELVTMSQTSTSATPVSPAR
jgi:hypothetical protein